MNNEKIGKLIKNARLSKGYTQKEIANKLGVTDKAVSKWECGKSFPDITMIESISRELGISVNQLVGVADNSKEEAVMLEKNEKKIKIRIMISIIIFQ
ncbi:Predicted transcription factor, homolog of eukaryotic MBF1 [Butyrivibrio fibrisolvens 16/4]|nr:Predicted transcription factor, homolog of eukaryotic MBF1 [Butyrivibrio fibrisolvens 16/4]